ncbi:response regulator [Profundibacterium mesophilum]|nr:response regulator [Profundibacterium mesophilum]
MKDSSDFTPCNQAVLVVEDEWLIAMDISEQLEEVGYHIVGPAHSVKEALALIDSDLVDLALLDINLAGEQSFDIAARLEREGIPFAFLTGNTATAHSRNFSAAAVLSKPVQSAELVECVHSIAPLRVG